MRGTRFVVGAVLALVCLAQSGRAQTSFPMLGGLLPVGVERGKTSVITLYGGGNGGANLYGAYKTLIEGKGVTAEVIPPEKGWSPIDKARPWALPSVTEVKLKVTVAPDAALGARELRIATARAGTSTVGQIIVSDTLQVAEAEPNNTPKQAQSVTLPCDVNGRFQQGEDVDYFKFKADAGQTLTFAVQCARLQDKVHDLSEHADPLIILTDPDGKELARNDDYYRADPLLSYKVEKAGEYTLQIRDVGYKGNPYWIYHLVMTTRPYVTQVTPCALRPGQSAEVEIGGFGLGGATKARVEIPAETPIGGIWRTTLTLPNGVSNPIPFWVSALPQTVAPPTPAGNKPMTAGLSAPAAKPLAIGSGVSAWVSREGQADRYSFKAKAGEAFGFETVSRRLDSTMDTQLRIRNAQGGTLAENDDFENVKDSRIEWSAPADGEYFVEVRDLAGKTGPTYYYNLSAERLEPDFTLKCDTDRAMIAPGNRTTWYIMLQRKNGFAGEVKIEVKGLPEGVSVTPLVIPANMTVGTLLFSAAAGAKIDASAIQITGTGSAKNRAGAMQTLVREVTPITEIYIPGGGRGMLPVRTQALAITETNDLEVTTNLRELTLKPGQTVKIEVTIKRRPDYTKPVTLDVRIQHLGGIHVDPLPRGVTCEDATIGENQTKGTITLRVANDVAEVKDLTLAVFANASINFVMKVWYAAEPIKLTVQK